MVYQLKLRPAKEVSAEEELGRLGDEAINEALTIANLRCDEASRILTRGDVFKASLRDIVGGYLDVLRVQDRFASEEVATNATYPSLYKVQTIARQTDILASIFPELRLETINEEDLPALPEGAEGWFVIPHYEALAHSYCDALLRVLTELGNRQRFYNWQKNLVTPERLRNSPCSRLAFEKLKRVAFDGETMVVPAQFGAHHKGRSARCSAEAMPPHEFGMPAYAAGIMLLTHSDRLHSIDDLAVSCAGDILSDACVPMFYRTDGMLTFGATKLHYPDESCGTASGFISHI